MARPLAHSVPVVARLEPENLALVANRKEGNQVFYSLRHPVVIKVLDIMRRYFQAHLSETVQMLHQIEAEERGAASIAVSRKEK